MFTSTDFYLDLPSPPPLLSGCPGPRNSRFPRGAVELIDSVSENQPLPWHDGNLPQRPAGPEPEAHAENLPPGVQHLPPHLVPPGRVSVTLRRGGASSAPFGLWMTDLGRLGMEGEWSETEGSRKSMAWRAGGPAGPWDLLTLPVRT